MRKHTATARPANSDFAKAYLEVKRLREDIERIEQSLKRRRSHEQVADSAPPKDDPRTGIARTFECRPAIQLQM